jgi:hypothetical protein
MGSLCARDVSDTRHEAGRKNKDVDESESGRMLSCESGGIRACSCRYDLGLASNPIIAPDRDNAMQKNWEHV